jgi:hypothetical protein
VKPFVMPVIEGYEHTLPEPGLYFGMSDEIYHRLPAFSNTGIKQMAASPLLFWSKARWMNPDYEERAPKNGEDHFDTGHAYEARILEGKAPFDERFAVELIVAIIQMPSTQPRKSRTHSPRALRREARTRPRNSRTCNRSFRTPNIGRS